MAAEFVVPVDQLTGLALYIIPGENEMTSRDAALFSWHHANHPSTHLTKTLAGNALRNSQIEWVYGDTHNVGPSSYHAKVQGSEYVLQLRRDNPNLDERKVASIVLLACAGYVPDEGVDIHGPEPIIRPMSRQEREFLHTQNPNNQFGYQYIRYGYEPIRDFLRDYVVKQELGHLPERVIEEFLTTPNRESKLLLGRFLLREATRVGADDLRDIYAKLRQNQRLHPAMPTDANMLLFDKLGRRSHIFRLVDDLRDSLTAA